MQKMIKLLNPTANDWLHLGI